jgi:toxin ParE1/3/4
MRYSLHKRAFQQLVEIWAYTEAKWGDKQADKYLDGLRDALKNICAEPDNWRKVKDRRFAGIYFFRYEKHLVFFKQLGPELLAVISVLHNSMDLPSCLMDDVDDQQ